MAEPRHHLTRAPITEAVIDFRARINTSFDTNVRDEIGRLIGYGRAPQMIGELSVTFRQNKGAAPSPPTISNRPKGYKYTSSDGKYIAQFRADGMTFSTLPPYTEWETVFAESSRLWKIYWDLLKPTDVSRIAVRNINRLLLPLADFGAAPGKFLALPPTVPPKLKGGLSQFLMRFVGHEPDTHTDVIITQAADSKNDTPGFYALILDIDVFTTHLLPQDRDALLSRFPILREVKNRLFFAALTETAVDLFQ